MKKSISIFINEIKNILKDNLMSVILHGSVPLKDYKHGWSDIDVVCFTNSNFSLEQAEELKMLRQKLRDSQKHNKYFRKIEGIIVPFNEFKAETYSQIVYWGTSGQKIINNLKKDPFTMFELINHSKILYGKDEIYNLYERMLSYDKVFLIVPMYCGNPASLYFKFNERCQEFFMQNEDSYETIVSKLYIIGVYGDRNQNPDFIPCLSKWFECTQTDNHVLGIERHIYGQKIEDNILNVEEVRNMITCFIQ